VSLLALVALLRPVNLIALAFAVGAGARLSGGDAVAPLALVPVLAAAFGYARNDAVDVAADAVNRPGRPIASHRVSVPAAHGAAWGALGASWLLLLAAGGTPARAALLAFASAALYAYSPWGKTRGPLGAATIALLAGLAVVWGGTMGARPERSLAAALVAALVAFARECAKDLEDESGDRAAGRRTWPVTAGRAPVALAMRASAWAALATTPLPWLLGDVGAVYAVAAGVTSAPLLAWAATRAIGDAASAGRVSRALKGALLLGVGSLWAGA
jgi:4-hydroxybenzoate polyprenyltransferase